MFEKCSKVDVVVTLHVLACFSDFLLVFMRSGFLFLSSSLLEVCLLGFLGFLRFSFLPI